MAIIKPVNRIEEYRIRASLPNINEMSGRSGREDLTKFISRAILDELADVSGLTVDVGCGDGTLLKLLSQNQNITQCIGILPTSEEVARLVESITETACSEKIEVREGLSSCIPLDTNSADGIVINGVIHILDSDTEVEQTLSEIQRISKNACIIFLGEIPFRDESLYASKYGDSVVQWLFFVLQKRGLREFIAKLFWSLKCLLGYGDMLIKPKNFLVFDPDVFISLLSKYGLECIKIIPHKEVGVDGSTYESNSRLDYVLISHK